MNRFNWLLGTDGQPQKAASRRQQTLDLAMKSQLRFQVSTMLMCVGLLLLPWASTLFAIPKLPMQWSGFQHFLDIIILDVGPQLFIVAFLVASIFLIKAVWRRQWVCALQALGEMAACVFAIMLVPAY